MDTIPKSIEEEMKTSYLDYAMSVIVGRALPDAKDGLKPVQRRILYSMNELGITHSKAHKKCARIVGDTMGKYHPHGDNSIYDTLVRMAQPFSLRAPLIDGQGNFGSIDGDSPAAMRYTEARLSKIAECMLEDINKETVDFAPNFDGSLKEPILLPAMFPNLLVNGSSGIAVGMATNLPPHNLGEVIDGVISYIKNPEIDIDEIMEYIKGPDFPTGGMIYGNYGIIGAYKTGRGIIKIRGKAEIKETEKKKNIIINEIPYEVNKSSLIKSIAVLVKDKRIDGIVDLKDESDRHGIRIVIKLRRDVESELILEQLYEFTQMETSFGIINLALVDEVPKVLTIKEIITEFVKHRMNIIVKRSEFELRKASDREHILDGLLIALDNIDEVIKTIRASKDANEAKDKLILNFELTEIQAKAILEMRLQKLTGLEREKILKEHEEILKLIEELKDILDNESRRYEIMVDELTEVKEKYGNERKTEIIEGVWERRTREELIPHETSIIMVSNDGYIKRLPLDEYKAQRRGGKGLMNTTKDEDFVTQLYIADTHDYLLFFSNKGQVYWLRAFDIPKAGRRARGKAIINMLPRLDKDEHIQSTICVDKFDERYLIFSTKKGKIKKTPLMKYSRPRITGIRAITLEDNDELISTKLSQGDDEVILITRKGYAIRFTEIETRSMGRTAKGVIGVRLRKGDVVVSMALVSETRDLFTIMEKGYAKRTPVDDYRVTHRAGKGIINAKITDKNGEVIEAFPVEGEEELLITTHDGMSIRTRVSEVNAHGRATMGVKVMRLKPGDKIMAVAKIEDDGDEEDGENGEEE